MSNEDKDYIYWGIDASNKLIISDEPVESAIEKRKGKFVNTTVFTFDEEVYGPNTPWYPYADEITSIEVQGYVAPISTAYWFSDLFMVENIDVTELDTSNVTDMSWMFSGAGLKVTDIFTIAGMDNWDTRNVKDMSSMFNSAGQNAKTFELDLSSWDTGKVTDMRTMFYTAGYNAITWSIGDISNWDTDKVESTYNMFDSVHNITTIKDARKNGNNLDEVIADISKNDKSQVSNKGRSNEKQLFQDMLEWFGEHEQASNDFMSHYGYALSKNDEFEKTDKGDDAR